jgi:hypothetical protein
MAATKTHSAVSATLTAGAGDTTATGVDLTTVYDAAYLIKITNGATGPTNPAQVQPQVSGDNSAWYNLGGPLVAGTTNSAVYSWVVEIPRSALYVRTVSGSNTGQNVTLNTDVVELTGI